MQYNNNALRGKQKWVGELRASFQTQDDGD